MTGSLVSLVHIDTGLEWLTGEGCVQLCSEPSVLCLLVDQTGTGHRPGLGHGILQTECTRGMLTQFGNRFSCAERPAVSEKNWRRCCLLAIFRTPMGPSWIKSLPSSCDEMIISVAQRRSWVSVVLPLQNRCCPLRRSVCQAIRTALIGADTV